MSEAVICLVSNETEANSIIVALQELGFTTDQISALLPDKNSNKDLGHEKHSKAPEGTATGAGAGALVGGALGLLAGIGALAIPGAGPFIAAGPIMSFLSGAALGSTVGGVSGGLIGLGIPEYEAKQYEGKILDGNILLSVSVDNGEEAKEVESVYKEYGGRDIKRTTEAKVKS